jgi:hypothetical protein
MKYVAVLIIFAFASACAETVGDSEPSWDLADPDSSGSSDTPADGKADSASQDPGNGPSLQPPPTEVDLRSPTDLTEWEMDRPCRLDEPVEKPSSGEYAARSGGPASRLTVSEFDLRGQDMPFLEVLPDERHGSEFDYAYDLHAVPGDDVVLHLYAAHDAVASARFAITTLVDYEPVVATYSYWQKDRGRLIAETDALGFAHEQVDDFVVVDVVIPAENFEAGKLHEVGLAVTWPGHADAHHGDEVRRFPVFYGGWDVPRDLPCSTRPASVSPTPFEADVLDPTRRANHIGIFVDPMPSPRTAHLHEFRAAPGETVRVYATLFPRLDVEPDRAIVAVPLLDGVPVAEPRWLGQAGAEEAVSLDQQFMHVKPTVNMRFWFDVKMPVEPGSYDLIVMTWADPFVRWRSVEAEPPYGFVRVTNGDNRAGSNVLTFVVDRVL